MGSSEYVRYGTLLDVPSIENVVLLKSEVLSPLWRRRSLPFRGEGHRKVHARLKREGIRAGRNRILRVMKENNLLSPHRSAYNPPNPHDGQITTDAPNVMWGSDETKVKTVEDGWVWIFTVAEHWNTECLGWHVCKVGDRFAALEPVMQA